MTYPNDVIQQTAIRIRELRKSKGITQATFYSDTKIHIGRLEKGEINIRVGTLHKVCGYLGVTLGEFYSELEDDCGEMKIYRKATKTKKSRSSKRVKVNRRNKKEEKIPA